MSKNIKSTVQGKQQAKNIKNFSNDGNLVFLSNTYARTVMASALDMEINAYQASENDETNFEFDNFMFSDPHSKATLTKPLQTDEVHKSYLENAKTLLYILTDDNVPELCLTRFSTMELVDAVAKLNTVLKSDLPADDAKVIADVLNGLLNISIDEFQIDPSELHIFN